MNRRCAGLRKRHTERGAALVETAIVANLLFLLLFGIITSGIYLGYRQNLVQAANEAARAGAISNDPEAALVAAQQAVSAFDRSCNQDGLTCTAEQIPCPGAIAGEQCLRVVIEHDTENHPILAPMPLVSMLVPDRMTTQAIAVVAP